MPMVLGSELRPEVQQHALRRFLYRYTREHIPQWAKKEWKDGKPYPLEFDSDADWLAHTRFAVCRNGQLDERTAHCESNPTWPDNPELRR